MKKIIYILLLSLGFSFSAWAQAPTISNFSPASGCSGSTTVVINGTNFNGATNVTFGGLAAQSFIIVNATQITAIPANGNTGTIAVTNPFGTGTSAGNFTVNISPAPPAPVTATPASMCIGASSNLNATSAGNTIYWYTVPSGGISIGSSASGANFPVSPAVTTTYYAASSTGAAGGSQTFSYTGAMQTFTVPAGVTLMTLEAWGAKGNGGNGGNGGYAKGDLIVTPGQVLNIFVGGQTAAANAPGFNGGGIGHAATPRNGGGASDVRVGGIALANRVIVAGGGGSSSGDNNSPGGTGGGGTAVGSNFVGGGGGQGYGGAGGAGGANGGTGNTSCHSGGAGGGGLNSGGAGSCNTCYTNSCGTAGTLGVGGDGDGWENGVCYNSYGGTSGGGGGYYGGGGTSTGNCGGGGGGGGSSWTGSLTNPVFTPGIRVGDGQVVLSWPLVSLCESNTRTPVTVTITSPPVPTQVTATPANICIGASSNLNATSPGNIISWYTVPTGGVAIGSSPSGANFPVTPAVTTTYYASQASGPNGGQTFNYTGAVQNFTVPAGITSILIDARGAQGGTFGAATGGLGARMVGEVSVTPGQVLSVYVGQQGVASQNAGGGGGGSGVSLGATPLVIAGGGGGGCSVNLEVGKPGLITTTGGNSSGAGGAAGNGGQKGYQSGDCGWAGGGGGFFGDGYGGNQGGDGGALPGILGGPAGGKSRANGGAGGIGGCCGFSPLGSGGWGCGGGGRAEYGGGGGGGYSGGGGGQYVAPVGSKSGGGGGSFNSGVNQSNTPGFQTGNGQVILSWSAPCPSARVPVTVTVNPLPTVTASASILTPCAGSPTVLTGNGAATYLWNPGALAGNPVTVSPLVPTIYTVTGSDAIGCSATSTVSISTTPVAAAPNPVTATPSLICGNGTSQLNSTGAAGSTQSWYTVPSGGVAIGTSPSGVNFPVSPAVTTTYYVETMSNIPPGSQTFNFTGAMQTFTVPPGVTSVTINAFGAQGVGLNGFVPGNGGRAQGVLSVTPGQVLNVFVGGTNAYNGGGIGQGGANGGGASDVRVGGIALADRVIVAGGGGGAGGDNWQCLVGSGHGGGGTAIGANFVGGAGGAGYTAGTGCGANGGNAGGAGGTGFHGGGGGGGGFISGGTGANANGFPAGNGALGVGGASYNAPGCGNTGGGGGGYYGGGGAAGTNCGAGRGGGGSSWTGTLTSPIFAAGTQTGNGQVIISWLGGVTCPSTPRVPVTVSVYPAAPVVTSSPASATVCEGTSVTLTATAVPNFPLVWSGGVVNATPFIPLTTTTYTVSATDANGCTGSTTVLVTVNPINTGTGSASPASICLGNTTTITGAATPTCTGNISNFAGYYAPANWVFSVTNSNGTVNAGGAPANIILSSGTNLSGTPGTTNYTRTVGCNGTVSFNWSYTHADAFGSIFDYPRYTINGGAPVVLNGFFIGGSNIQNGTQTIPVNVGDVLQLQMYTLDNDNIPGYTTISAFSAPALGYTGTVSIWDAAVGGNNLGASPQVVTPAAAGVVNYYIEVTTNGPGNCVNPNRIPVPVTVNTFANLTASASPAIICPGGTSVLSAANGVSYIWNPGAMPGSPTVSPVATTTYTVTGTNGAGCTGTNTVTVTVDPIPTVTATASPSALCLGGSAVLTANGASTYLWNPGALTGAPTVTPAVTTTYTVTGTNAGGCTATTTLTVVVNGLPVVTANPATQTVCEMGMATVNGGGAASYAWTGGISNGVPFMVMASGTYTVTGTDANGCSNTATAEVIMNNAPIVSASATPNTTCDNTTVTPNATGAASYVWTAPLVNGVPFVANATATYTVTGTDGAGCTATSTVTVTVNPMSGILAPATSNQAQDHGDDFDINYYAANCDLIATVDDGAGGNVLGLTTSTVNVDATAGMHNGQPFVRRWYQITPTNNGSADVILYINQSDFDDYNTAVALPYLPLPTSGNNADPNIPNIRITKNDDAGLGNNPVVITPAVNWNGTYWELSFNTPSFSQFRVHSVNPGNVPLPATLTSFTGIKLESSDKLSWTTSSEHNNAYFNLQHSTDGIHFSTIAKVNSQAINGNSATTLNYNALNNKPNLGHNYYRLQQADLDNKLSVHAEIVDLIRGTNGNTVSIYPNPTTDVLNIDLYAQTAQNTTVKLLDMSGRVIKQIQAKSAVGMNNIKLSMGELAKGVYTIQVYENNTLSHTGKVRKN